MRIAVEESVVAVVIWGPPRCRVFAYRLYVYPTYRLYVNVRRPTRRGRSVLSSVVFQSLARLDRDEDLYPSRIRSLARSLLVRQRLLHALHEARAPRGDLLPAPSVLYGQAEAGLHGR